MDHYSAERTILERHHEMARTAERRARLGAVTEATVKAWMAYRLRSLADRLDGAALVHPQRPTA